jgi:mercuric ion transport protein
MTYFMGAIALLTCPCHLPILLVLFSGTAAGALLAENLGLTTVLLLVVFLISVTATVRLISRKGA